ncbi:MAG: cytochrome c oxidase assembly protein [Gemmatimonadales bacterium]
MTWWCSAQGGAWSWTWQPYIGVWLLALTLIIARLTAPRIWAPDRRRSDKLQLYILGVLVLWLGADWPIGPLGAGYLLSVHTVQYLLFTFVAPPLLIAGTPPWMLRRLLRPQWALRSARTVGKPIIAFGIFNTVLLATHLPAVVDGLTVSQIGSFAIDMSWLLSGLIFWWPVLGPLPELEPLSYPGRIVYLIMNVFIPTVPAAFLTFAHYPIYGLYELAAPVGNISTAHDQQIAGIIMKVVGGFIIFGTASVIFFKWSGSEEDSLGVLEAADSSPAGSATRG